MQRHARLQVLDAHPDVVAWKAASGMSIVDRTLRRPPSGGDGAAAVRRRADAGDAEAALILAMNPDTGPDEAIRHLEIAALGGYATALFQIALQYERKSLANGGHPLMLRLRRTADPELGPLDEEYLAWLHAAAMLDDVLGDNLLRRGLSTLSPRQVAAAEQRARDHLAVLDRKRAERGLPPLRGAAVSDAVREYVDLRFSPPDPADRTIADHE